MNRSTAFDILVRLPGRAISYLIARYPLSHRYEDEAYEADEDNHALHGLLFWISSVTAAATFAVYFFS